MTFHSEAISTEQQKVLQDLGPVISENEFDMGSGTALALHLGHRRSDDFDWFTRETIADPLRLAQHLRDAKLDFAIKSERRLLTLRCAFATV